MDTKLVKHRGKFISYLRVSTKRQGASGLGLEAQRAAVTNWLNGGDWKIIEEVVEVESGKDDSNRPALQRALEACRRYGAKLVIAKLDRLGRNPSFLLSLRDAGIDFICCDMPDANRLTVGIMACVAEAEREAISERTRVALQAAKARGQVLGNPRDETRTFHNRKIAKAAAKKAGEAVRDQADRFAELVKPVLDELAGLSANAIANEMNKRGVKTQRGGHWSARHIINLRQRLEG